MNSLPAYKRSEKSISELMPAIASRVIGHEPLSPVEAVEMRDSIWVRWEGSDEWVMLAFSDSESTHVLDKDSNGEAVIISPATFAEMTSQIVSIHSACLASDSTLPTESSPSSAA